ncbi:hypothetical protein MMC25_003235 [Agyrium rufum]|nr:hypothetical protein [Agyrium rufum]
MESQPIAGIAPNPHQSPAERRGRHIPPIQTTFVSKPAQSRLHRNRPIETIVLKETKRVPLTPEVVTVRSPSRNRLRGLFSRSKTTKILASTAASPIVEKKFLATTPESKRSDTPANGLRNKGDRAQNGPLGKVVSRETTLVPLSLNKTNSRGQSQSKPRPTPSLRPWEPPPLFQAYPQAVMYEILPAPPVAAETLLRMEKNRLALYARVEHARTPLGMEVMNEDSADAAVTGTDSASRPKSRTSGAISKFEWTTKVYVLATSGYLLQYAGEGPFDRYPEKILQLDRSSAAFASDAIPGELYVLQVSQVSSEDGPIVRTSSRSVFQKMSLRGDTRKAASTMLLVFEASESMSKWLIAIRKEIESLGGKQCQPDVGSQESLDERKRNLTQKPSRRFLIQRDPHQFGHSPVQTDMPTVKFDHVADEGNVSPSRNNDPAASIASTNRFSYITQSSSVELGTSRTSFSTQHTTQRDSKEEDSIALADEFTEVRFPIKPASTVEQSPALSANSGTLPLLDETSKRRSFVALPSPGLESPVIPDMKPRAKAARPLSTMVSDTGNNTSTAPNFSFPSRNRLSMSPAALLDQKSSFPQTQTRASSSLNHHHTDSETNQSETSERPLSVVGELPSAANRSPKLGSRMRTSHSSTTLSTHDQFNAPYGNVHSRPRPRSVHSDQSVPRRFSSLEYSQGKLPYRLPTHAPAPHPPPQTALPALPPAPPQAPQAYEDRRPQTSSAVEHPLSSTRPSLGRHQSSSASSTISLTSFPQIQGRERKCQSRSIANVDSPTITSPLPFAEPDNVDMSVSYFEMTTPQPRNPQFLPLQQRSTSATYRPQQQQQQRIKGQRHYSEPQQTLIQKQQDLRNKRLLQRRSMSYVSNATHPALLHQAQTATSPKLDQPQAPSLQALTQTQYQTSHPAHKLRAIPFQPVYAPVSPIRTNLKQTGRLVGGRLILTPSPTSPPRSPPMAMGASVGMRTRGWSGGAASFGGGLQVQKDGQRRRSFQGQRVMA